MSGKTIASIQLKTSQVAAQQKSATGKQERRPRQPQRLQPLDAGRAAHPQSDGDRAGDQGARRCRARGAPRSTDGRASPAESYRQRARNRLSGDRTAPGRQRHVMKPMKQASAPRSRPVATAGQSRPWGRRMQGRSARRRAAATSPRSALTSRRCRGTNGNGDADELPHQHDPRHDVSRLAQRDEQPDQRRDEDGERNDRDHGVGHAAVGRLVKHAGRLEQLDGEQRHGEARNGDGIDPQRAHREIFAAIGTNAIGARNRESAPGGAMCGGRRRGQARGQPSTKE